MHLISQLLSSLFVITALLFSLLSSPADWMVELGAPADFSGRLRSLQRSGEQLSHHCQWTLVCMAVKERIAAALTSGEMTLIEAATCFRSLYEDPQSWHHPNRPRPQLDDGESWCREVIEWLDNSVRIIHSSDEADALRRRLEEELQEQLEYFGVVRLAH
jgi:hypothetical protein